MTEGVEGARATPGRRRASDWWLYGGRGLVVSMQALVFLLMASLMTPGEFGRAAFAIASARLAAALVSFGIAGYLLREIPARMARGVPTMTAGRLVILAVALPLAASVVLVLAGRHLPLGFHAFRDVGTGGGSLVLAIGALGFAFALSATVGTLVRVRFGGLAGMIVQQAMPFAALLLVILPRLAGIRHGVPEFLMLAATLILVCCGALLLREALGAPRMGSEDGSMPPLGRELREALPFWGNGILITLATQIDLIVGAVVIGDTGLGSYALIRNVANLIAMPRMIANWAIAARVARAWAILDRDALKRSVADGRRLAVVPALGGAAVILLSAPLWFMAYDVPLDAIWPWVVLVLLIAANLATALFGLAIICASQCGLEGLTMRVRIAALVAGSAVAMGAGAIAGPEGVALGVLTMTAFLNVTMSLFVRARTGIVTF